MAYMCTPPQLVELHMSIAVFTPFALVAELKALMQLSIP